LSVRKENSFPFLLRKGNVREGKDCIVCNTIYKK